MKIKRSSRIAAIVLALLMIVPMISIPAVAETTATKVDTSKATPVASDDFENYAEGSTAPNNGLVSGPSTTVIATVDGNKVLKYDNVPASTNKDGQYFINLGGNNNNWATVKDYVPDLDDDDNDIADGTVTISGSTYYFKAALINYNNLTTQCKLYSDSACTTEYTGYSKYYLCSAKVKNARLGATNIAQPSALSIANGQTGNYLVFTADYYFDTDYKAPGMDIRVNAQTAAGSKQLQFGQIVSSGSDLLLQLHGDLTTSSTGGTALTNKGVVIKRGEWTNITMIADATDGEQTTLTLYVNGKLAAVGTQPVVMTGTYTSAGWNLGHIRRGYGIDSYAGGYYVDNCAIYNTADVIPSTWETFDPNQLYSEDFENYAVGSTTVPSSFNYGGSSVKIDTIDGQKALVIDCDTYDEVNGTSNDGVGNIDKNLILCSNAWTSGIVSVTTDMYIPTGTVGVFQSQFRSVNNNGTTGTAWVDGIRIVANGTSALIDSLFANTAQQFYSTSLPMDEWFTMQYFFNLTSGQMIVNVNGKTAASCQLYKNGDIQNFTVNAGSSSAGFILFKMMKMSGTNPTNTSYPEGYKGYVAFDNVSVTNVSAMPKIVLSSADVDFEDKTDGAQANSPSNTPTAAPSTAKYVTKNGNTYVSISMKGQTTDSVLAAPFIVVNSRSYDITVTSDSFTAPAELTVEWLEENMTYTGSISGTNDKPIYYTYVESENKVYVYNNGGKKATEDNIGGFTLSEATLSLANYSAANRAVCGGKDTNIDKNFRVSHPGLAAAGTYVLSADYYVAANAKGIVAAQSYAGSSWLDLYSLDLTAKKFYAYGTPAAGLQGQPLRVEAWNTVTMIVTVADDLTFSVDTYLNGVYCFTKSFDKTFMADSWILAKPVKPTSAEQAAELNGEILLDNVKVNAVEYKASDIVTVDASKAYGFTIGADTLGQINISASTELKIYARGETVAVFGQDRFEQELKSMGGYIVKTLDKASIRVNNSTGLRFVTQMSSSGYNALTIILQEGYIRSIDYGTLIAPSDYLSETDEELRFDMFTPGDTMLDVACVSGVFYNGYDDDPDTYHFAGSIVDIMTANMDRAFTGRGYVKVTLLNGAEYVFYSDSVMSISVAQQAQKTLDAGVYTEGSAEYDIVAGFAAYANN